METNPGGVITYISSSSGSSSPASCHSELLDSSSHVSSSSLPPSPGSSTSEGSCSGGSSDLSTENCSPIAGGSQNGQLLNVSRLKAAYLSADFQTKSRSGVTRNPSGLLLQCKVCGDVASGFHYGVHACEGCKGFFRRSIQQNIQYRKCQKEEGCSIARLSRNRCQQCRFKKCLSVGMSRDAVRFGRIPKHEKQRMLLEVHSAMKNMMNSQFSSHLQNDVVAAHPPSPPTPLPQEQLTAEAQWAPERRGGLLPPSQAPPPTAHISKEEVIRSVTRLQRDTFMYNQEQPGDRAAAMVQPQGGVRAPATTEEHPPNSINCRSGIHCPPGQSQQHLHGPHRGLMCHSNEQVICPNYSSGHVHGVCSRVPACERFHHGLTNSYSCGTARKMHLVCPMSLTPCIDPHKSGHQIWEEFSMSFTPAVKEVVEFAKRIPGFRDLSQHDQVNLLKAGTLEVLMVRFASLFNAKERAVTFLSGKKYSVDELQSMGAGDLLRSMFDFSEKLRALHLSEEEMSLFTAVVLVSADRSGIENVNSVECLQEMLIRALKTLIRKKHPSETSTFTKLLLKLPDLRSLSNMHSEELLAFKIHP